MTSTGIPSNIAFIAGPQLIGHLFNYGLFGVLSAQVYTYHLNFPTDPKRLKMFIYGLYVVECIQVMLATHDAVEVFGIGWGNLEALNSPQWLWFDTPVMSGAVSASVQCFFAWRIYILSNSAVLALFICAVALMQGAGGIASGVFSLLIDNNASLQTKILAPLIVWLGGSCACDIIIAACMLYFLAKGKRGMGSDALITRLMRVTIETGTMTASVASLDLILFLTFKHNNLHMAPALVLSKLYTNSMMMVFNNRSRMRAMFRGEVHSSSGGTSRNRGGHSRSIESEPVFNTISLKDISTTASDALSSTRAGDYSVASTRKGDMNDIV